MDLKQSDFRYNAVLKNEQDISFEGLSLFPSLSEISFQSKIFQNYAECVKSCKSMMEDMTRDVNAAIQDQRFKVGAEVNPIHTGAATLSKDWGVEEVARFWVYNKAMEGGGGPIAAICKSSIFAIPKMSPTYTVN